MTESKDSRSMLKQWGPLINDADNRHSANVPAVAGVADQVAENLRIKQEEVVKEMLCDE
jgi:hypothetical protein